jgi:hypothetical protein
MNQKKRIDDDDDTLAFGCSDRMNICLSFLSFPLYRNSIVSVIEEKNAN